MASQSSLPDEDLLCCVCCDVFTDPVLLSCTHSVCRNCVLQFWKNKGARECPVCRRRCSKEHPPLNRALKNLCEAFQEKKNRNHTLCPEDEAVTDLKEKLQAALKTIQKNQNILQEAKQAYHQTATHIKTQAQHTKRQIKAQFEKLHQFLRAEEAARKAALKKEEEQKSQVMKRKIKEMDGRISLLSVTIGNIEKMMKAEDIQLLQNFRSMEKLVQCSSKTPEETPGALINVAKHLSNLKFRVWEKMKEIVQYTPITLDPNTAAPHLHLSEDLTTIKYRNENALVLDNPERFDKYLCVVGSEGFSSGTHCWDVQAGDGHNWELGLIAERVSRKGQHFLGSVWTLGYNDVHVKFWTRCPGEAVSTFTLGQKLQRVRVQLDWDRGKLTFTDLLTNTHLRTITHTFTERVLPYFCTGSDHPLKILAVPTAVRVEQHSSS